MIRVGVVGGTGYTGVELLRLLLRHPGVTVSLITSRGEAGRRLDDLFPSLLGACDLAFSDPAKADYSTCDLVFFATPHNVAMREVSALMERGIRVIDLSADFRLRDVAVWEQWYVMLGGNSSWLMSGHGGETSPQRFSLHYATAS